MSLMSWMSKTKTHDDNSLQNTNSCFENHLCLPLDPNLGSCGLFSRQVCSHNVFLLLISFWTSRFSGIYCYRLVRLLAVPYNTSSHYAACLIF